MEALEDYFDRLGEAVLTQIETQKDFTVSQVFDFDAWLAELEAVVGEIARAAAQAGFVTGAQRTGINPDFDPDSRAAQETIRRLIEKVEASVRTTERDLRRQITEGLEQNETIDEIMGRVRRYIDEDAKPNRARLVAQTTVTGGFEAQQLEAFRAAGFEGKRWITQRDAAVRPTHQAAGTQERPLEMPFEVGGAALMHPGDPTGPIDEVARCRCTMFPVQSLSDDE